jgi:hypothetical protein
VIGIVCRHGGLSPEISGSLWLWQRLVAERQRAVAIDRRNDRLLLAEIPFRASVAADSVAADKLSVNLAYDILTPAPNIYMGLNRSGATAEAIGAVVGVRSTASRLSKPRAAVRSRNRSQRRRRGP